MLGIDILFAALAVAAPGKQAPQAAASGTVLQSIRIDASSPSAPIVVIEGGGPLPFPHVGVLDGPPRIYLDFPGITTGAIHVDGQAESIVRGVRVALFRPSPPITRVVIDLTQPTPHRVDARERASGRVGVLLMPREGRPAANDPQPKPAPRTPTRSAERDRAALLAAVEQLERLRPVLSAIDSRTDINEESLSGAISEFDTIKQTLTALGEGRAPESLLKVCILGMTAASTRLDGQQHGDASRVWNAASAAAGALILLDRAASSLRNPSAPK